MKHFIATLFILTSSIVLAETATTVTTKKVITKKTTPAKATIQTTHTTQSAVVHETPKASGGEFTNEILTNVTMGSLNIEKQCKNCDSQTSIDLHASYLRLIQDKIQAGAEGGINFISGGGSQTFFDLAGVGAYNFDTDFSNSFYVKAGLGIFTVPVSTLSGSSTETKLGLFVGGGKRFSWLSNVNFSPEVRLVKKGDLDVGIEASILNFAIHWN